MELVVVILQKKKNFLGEIKILKFVILNND